MCVLAGAQIYGGAVGEGEDGGVVGGLVNDVCLCMKGVFSGVCFEEGKL